ncbi:hypothetical protein DL96DRAFT_1488062, partial [Flagelloscypha sp. PMI_526]
KIPEDAPGQELGPDARVFKIYNELADEYDRSMLRGFRDTLDSLLIFAPSRPLFSAVITTFVVQTAQALRTDQAAVTNHLLINIATLIRANSNSTSLAAIPFSQFGPDTSTYQMTDIWINGLFFTSLSLSLATALLSVLAKQWLQVTFCTALSRSARDIALIRHPRFCGLERWKMHEIIGALPLILHTSLALFFVGLFVFIRTLNRSIAYPVLLIGGVAFCSTFVLSSSPQLISNVLIELPFSICRQIPHICGTMPCSHLSENGRVYCQDMHCQI